MWAIQQWLEKPNSHPDAARVDPAGPERRTRDLPLERRGHCFCRYADDCNIYVQSLKAGQRVMASITRFLERKLRLGVNRDKSSVAFVQERKFLGHRLLPEGHLGIAPQSLARAKERVRQITRRSRGVSIEQVIGELNTEGMSLAWFDSIGLVSLTARYAQLNG